MIIVAFLLGVGTFFLGYLVGVRLTNIKWNDSLNLDLATFIQEQRERMENRPPVCDCEEHGGHGPIQLDQTLH